MRTEGLSLLLLVCSSRGFPLHVRTGRRGRIVVRSDGNEGREPTSEDDGEAERIRRFRERLIRSSAEGDELKVSSDSPFSAGDPQEPTMWGNIAEPVAVPGRILLGNPEVFCSDKTKKNVLDHFGLAMPIPGPGELDPDTRANLLPVILIVENDEASTVGLMLNRRTGYLMGDLPQDVSGFMIQPLNLGGTQKPADLTFLHPYPEIGNSNSLSDDGLYYGGEFKDAQMVVNKGTGSQFQFRFFIQRVQWSRRELDQELKNGMWFAADCSKDVILKIREREGLKRPKPLWTDVMELCGGNYGEICDGLYR